MSISYLETLQAEDNSPKSKIAQLSRQIKNELQAAEAEELASPPQSAIPMSALPVTAPAFPKRMKLYSWYPNHVFQVLSFDRLLISLNKNHYVAASMVSVVLTAQADKIQMQMAMLKEQLTQVDEEDVETHEYLHRQMEDLTRQLNQPFFNFDDVATEKNQ